MHYKIAYIVKDGDAFKRKHRYYTALNKDTALGMFEASTEQSLVGEAPEVKNIFVNKSKEKNKYDWVEDDEEEKEEI